VGADGKELRLESPYGDELPAKGFDPGMDTYQAPPQEGKRSTVQVRPVAAAGCFRGVCGLFGLGWGALCVEGCGQQAVGS